MVIDNSVFANITKAAIFCVCFLNPIMNLNAKEEPSSSDIALANKLSAAKLGLKLFNQKGSFELSQIEFFSPSYFLGASFTKFHLSKNEIKGGIKLQRIRFLGSGKDIYCSIPKCIVTVLQDNNYSRVAFEWEYGTPLSLGDRKTIIPFDWYKSPKKPVYVEKAQSYKQIKKELNHNYDRYIFNTFGLVLSRTEPDEKICSGCVEVAMVAQYSPADLAGLRAGDHISGLDGAAVYDTYDLFIAIYTMKENRFRKYHPFRVTLARKLIDNGFITANDQTFLYFKDRPEFPIPIDFENNFQISEAELKLVTRAEALVKQRRIGLQNRVNFWRNFGKLAKSDNYRAWMEHLNVTLKDFQAGSNAAYQARLQEYLASGKFCVARTTVIYCQTTDNNNYSYLGKGLLLSNRTVSSSCSGSCANHTGPCDTKKGVKYGNWKQAELDNCRPASQSDLDKYKHLVKELGRLDN